MSFKSIQEKLNKVNLSSSFGVITKVTSSLIEANGITPAIGDVVKIISKDKESLGMVSQIEKSSFFITSFSLLDGLNIGDKIYINSSGMSVGVGDNLLGRVVNALIKPIDNKGDIEFNAQYPMMPEPISALNRKIINEPLATGVKVIDSMLTCGKGQKIGIFAGSGVGKSTLMGMIAKGTSAKIKVIALIGERGREVKEFIQHNLNNDLSNTVIIAVTSDDSPLMRKYGAFAAMSVAEYFKNKGEDVLLIMDSITRFAMAQREISLALKEPPTSKGYTASTLTLLPKLMERAGGEEGKGTITAFFTILVDGDDMRDPVADQSRSILDGHIILDRDIAQSGIYPPIDILSSASRVMNNVTSKDQQQSALRFRRLYSTLKENEALIRIGAYQKGNDALLDEAILKKDNFEEFITQDEQEIAQFNESIEKLQELVKNTNSQEE
jgi:flagellum-specific ATP synthase